MDGTSQSRDQVRRTAPRTFRQVPPEQPARPAPTRPARAATPPRTFRQAPPPGAPAPAPVAPAGYGGPAAAPAAAAGGQPAAGAGRVHLGVDGRPCAPPAKSKGIAVLLCLLLGGFGGHNLYLGHYGRGAGQAALTLVAYPVLLKIGLMPLAVLGVAPAVALWVIVELILILAGAGGYRGQLRPQPIGPAGGVG